MFVCVAIVHRIGGVWEGQQVKHSYLLADSHVHED